MRCGDSSVDFSFSTQSNLNFKPSVDAEMDVEEDGTERFEKGGVSTDQLDWFLTRMLTNWKNMPYLYTFWV